MPTSPCPEPKRRSLSLAPCLLAPSSSPHGFLTNSPSPFFSIGSDPERDCVRKRKPLQEPCTPVFQTPSLVVRQDEDDLPSSSSFGSSCPQTVHQHRDIEASQKNDPNQWDFGELQAYKSTVRVDIGPASMTKGSIEQSLLARKLSVAPSAGVPISAEGSALAPRSSTSLKRAPSSGLSFLWKRPKMMSL